MADDDHTPPGWAKAREPRDEPRASSLTAGAGHDKWAKRAAEHSFGAKAARSDNEIADAAKRRARIAIRIR